MITARTVLVTGAGASCPYGFPLGGELLNTLYSLDKSDIGARILEQSSFSRADLEVFCRQLKATNAVSIDEFLALQRYPAESLVKEIAKYCIAFIILDNEKTTVSLNLPEQDDWYTYLWRRLSEGLFNSFLDMNKNNLGVITFNYDRSLEKFLMESIQDRFFGGPRDEKITHAYENTPVIHLYGPSETLFRLPYGESLAYGEGATRERVEKFARDIKTIHDDFDASLYPIIRAKDLLKNAERIVFLGFGFDKFNLEKFSELMPPTIERNAKDYMATSYRLSKSVIFDARVRMFGKVASVSFRDTGKEITCLTALQESGVLYEFYDA